MSGPRRGRSGGPPGGSQRAADDDRPGVDETRYGGAASSSQSFSSAPVKQDPGTQIAAATAAYAIRELPKTAAIDATIEDDTSEEGDREFMRTTRGLFVSAFQRLAEAYTLIYRGTSERTVAGVLSNKTYIQAARFGKMTSRTQAAEAVTMFEESEDAGDDLPPEDVSKKAFYVPAVKINGVPSSAFLLLATETKYTRVEPGAVAADVNPWWLTLDTKQKAAVRIVFQNMLLLVTMWTETFYRNARAIAPSFAEAYIKETASPSKAQFDFASQDEPSLLPKYTRRSRAYWMHQKLMKVLQEKPDFLRVFDAHLTTGRSTGKRPLLLRAILQEIEAYADAICTALLDVRTALMNIRDPKNQIGLNVEDLGQLFHDEKVRVAQAAASLAAGYSVWTKSARSTPITSRDVARWAGEAIIDLGRMVVASWDERNSKTDGKMPPIKTIPYYVFFLQFIDTPKLGLMPSVATYAEKLVAPTERGVKEFVLRNIAGKVNLSDFVAKYRAVCPITQVSPRFSLDGDQYQLIKTALNDRIRALDAAAAQAEAQRLAGGR